jgi:deoxycytidylate deaminase
MILENPKSELVIGLVAPLGANLDSVVKALEDRFQHFGYSSNSIKLSALIKALQGLQTELRETPHVKRYDSYMDAGNEARRKFGRGDFLALSALYQIAKLRSVPPKPLSCKAHILRSLKHPAEVSTLRKVYGPGFFLLGVHAPPDTRRKYLTKDLNMSEDDANRLIRRDESEKDEFGQRTRDTFELCDAFIALHQQDFKEKLWRIMDLLFGDPFQTPTRDEYAMFLAYAASLRSADLSRQVGAVVMSESEEIISTGANDVPRFGGGLYWPDAVDQRDHKRGFDSNAKYRDEMILKIMKALEIMKNGETQEEALNRGREILQDTGLFDITEFGRAVHAEMEAILSCARVGASPRNGTLFCTTFPCHNCAKHIVACGIRRVVYVEPYPKSQAEQLHNDSIDLSGFCSGTKVVFEPFVGVGPRRFIDLFSMRMSTGHEVVRKSAGTKVDWQREGSNVRVPLAPTSYLEREMLMADDLNKITGGLDGNKKEAR